MARDRRGPGWADSEDDDVMADTDATDDGHRGDA